MVLEFSEKIFFLKAFQGQTLTLVCSSHSDLTQETLNSLVGVLQELLKHRAKLFILWQEHPVVAHFLDSLNTRLGGLVTGLPTLESDGLPTRLWRDPSPLMALGYKTEKAADFLVWVGRLGVALRLPRVLLLDQSVGLDWCDVDGKRLNFVNYHRLKKLSDHPVLASNPEWGTVLIQTAQNLLTGGVGAVTLCRLQDLEIELFSYEGQGIFFSRRHYCQVRRLTLDDFAQAAAVIRRGESEGFLLPRDDDGITAILLHGYGAFLADHHLSGVCGLVTKPYKQAYTGEITALYALTRFHGEGVGGRLIARLEQEARKQCLTSLFACVGDVRAVAFFCHHGFHQVSSDQLPAEKWLDYPLERKARVICLQKKLTSLSSSK